MAVLLEGIGDDWVVMRREGGSPELLTFSSLGDLRRHVIRMLAKAEQARSVKRNPVKLPQAEPRAAPSPPPPPPPPVKAAQAVLKPTVYRDPKKVPPSLPEGTDCMTCGACCAPKDQRKDTHPALEKEDVEQLPSVLRKSLVVNDGGQPYIKTKKGPDGKTVCAAFKGTVGGRCKCGIYDKRPMVCRIFEKGSPECLDARANFGL